MLLSVYVGPAEDNLYLSIEDAAYSSGINYDTATMIREIKGIQVVYNLDEYVFLPPEAEEEEHSLHSGIVFIKDGIYYHLFGMDTDLTADDFFAMATDFIDL